MDRVTADARSNHNGQPQQPCRQSNAWWSLLPHCWQCSMAVFPEGLQGGFQLIGPLRRWLEFIVLFQHGTRDIIVQIRASLVCSDLECFSEPSTVRLQPVLHDDRMLRNGGLAWFKQHKCIISSFSDIIFIRLGNKVYFCCLTVV